jgi:phage terminase large subunit GpA-like protein
MRAVPGYLNPRKLIAARLAAAIRPPARMPFDKWLPSNIVLIDGPQAGELWSADGAPYLPGIAACMSDDHPCNLVTVRKCQQSGASILALGWGLYVADQEPANMLYCVPGDEAKKALNNTKFQPLTDAYHKRVGRTVILPQMSRSGDGSTTYEKRFRGGFLKIGNANSVMDLSMITVRKGVKDEVSKWQDIPGFGDPETLFFGRFTAHRRVADWKILEISTPEVDSGLDDLEDAEGHCRIDRSFRASDQRYWHCQCPHCGVFFVHRFENLRIDARHPHRSAYQCECGDLISEAERVVAVRGGHWESILPEDQREGRHPGFHVDAFISLMMSYGAIAQDWINARTETEKKAFYNLVLGLPYKYGGDAPDHVRLAERKEADLIRGHVPPRGLMITAFADVQMRGIWLLIRAHAPNRESWVIEAEYIDGDTASAEGTAFEQLRKKTIDREFPDAFGGKRTIDALAVDSGYRSHVVYSWVRKHQRVHPLTGHDVILATKGLKGWNRPALGQPTLVDIDMDGKVVRQGVKVWGIGTWPLKSGHYTNLHREKDPQELVYPDGYCHHGAWLDEVFFRQITAEYLKEVRFRGRVTGRVWDKTGPNHYLDCYVGCDALAEYLGISITTAEAWAALAAVRGLPPDLSRVDLFTARSDAPPAPAALPRAEAEPAQTEPDGRKPAGWLSTRPAGRWLR